MLRLAVRLSAIALALALLAASPAGAAPAQAGEVLPSALVNPLELRVLHQPDRETRAAMARIAPDLLRLEREFREHAGKSGGRQGFRSRDHALPVRGGFVTIDAAASDSAQNLLRALEVRGLQDGAARGRMVSGQLPIAAISGLQHLPGLQFARPAYAMTQGGLTSTQGDIAVHADQVRASFGVDGTGITIGTLSDSYDCLGGAQADVASGDLPAGVTVLLDETRCGSGSDEGRAMMQLIHDLAPGAHQAFHSAFVGGQAGFANGILDLANLAGADVIVDDVIYFAEPMFQDGIVAQAVNTVVGQGVLYFSAAGNSGRNSYQSDFRPSGLTVFGAGEAHDFDPGAETDVLQRISVPVGATLIVTLQWDSPFYSVSGAPGSRNDLDIFLTDEPATRGLAASQTSNVGGDAVEILAFTNDGSFGTSFNVVIEHLAGDRPGLIKYVVIRGTIDELATHSSTLYGHANAAGAEAVGAAAYYRTPAFGATVPVLESFSSAGPTPIRFDTAGRAVTIHRQKPDITCVDGGNTTFFGSDVDGDRWPNFFGTSAAAPHAAAIAALMLDLDPTLTQADVLGVMEGTALDMGEPGIDDDSGAGLCQADLAVAAIATSAIRVTRTASVARIDEPGGLVAYEVRVENTGNSPLRLTGLHDDTDGDLDGQGTCIVPQSIATGGFYACRYSGAVSGRGGTSITTTTRAEASGPAGSVTEEATAMVAVTDVQPSLNLSYKASEVAAPAGAVVTLDVQIENAGSAEAVRLIALVDDRYGNLDGQGDCALPQTIPASGSYHCSFSARVNSEAGNLQTSTLTVSAEDDEGNGVQASSTVVIDVLPPATADLSVAIVGQADTVVAGSKFSYRVLVTNQGAFEAVNVVLSSELPDGLTALDAAGCAEASVDAGSCALGTLQPGESKDLVVSARIDENFLGPFSIHATTSSDSTEGSPGDETASLSLTSVSDRVLTDGFEE